MSIDFKKMPPGCAAVLLVSGGMVIILVALMAIGVIANNSNPVETAAEEKRVQLDQKPEVLVSPSPEPVSNIPYADAPPPSEEEAPLLNKTCKISLIEQSTFYNYHPQTPEIRYLYKSYSDWCDIDPRTFSKAFRSGKMTTIKSGSKVKTIDYIQPLYKIEILSSKKIWWINQNDLELND